MTSETMALEDELNEGSPERHDRVPILSSEIDLVLTAQIVVAWAGESGEDKRLGWWRSDLMSEFGGEDLLRRLLPRTWRWAVLQSVREAARLKDAELRRQGHDSEQIVSLFNFGFAIDERIEDRLQELKRSGRRPEDALPGIKDGIEDTWNRQRFLDWVQGHGEPRVTVTTVGRRLQGTPPLGLEQQLGRLVSALAPLVDAYPLPHFRGGE